jgi:hypothetical protein
VAAADQADLDLVAQRADREDGAGVAGELERDPEVLPVERDLEPERVVVGDHPPASVRQDPALRGTTGQRLHDLFDIETCLQRKDDPFGHAEVGSGQDHLVDGLDRLPAPDRPDMGDGPADRFEDWTRALDCPGFATDEDRQSSLQGALAAAGYRCIDELDAGLLEPFAKASGGARRDRRSVDDEETLVRSNDHTIGAKENRFDVGRIGDADKDDARSRSGLRWSSRLLRPQVDQPAGLAGRSVPDCQRKAGTGDVRGHRAAHGPETEHCYVIHGSSWLNRVGPDAQGNGREQDMKRRQASFGAWRR